MEVTEVRVKLVGDRDDKLRAFCTVTFDHCFVVRDLKIIKGGRGLFVAMPSRKLTDMCHKCRGKNHLRARFCNECGTHLDPDRADRDESGRAKLHADVAHPIHQDYRDELQRTVLRAFEEELDRSRQPGYRPPDDDFDLADHDEAEDHTVPEPEPEPDEPSPPEPPIDSEDETPHHRFGEGLFP